jgi:hypothetical protein
MLRFACSWLILALVVAVAVPARGADKKSNRGSAPIVATTPAEAGPDFAVQGEYVGIVKADGNEVKFGAQIVALGDGKFHGIGFAGGLPGDGWDESTKFEADGQTKDGVTTFSGKDVSGTVKDGVITAKDGNGQVIATLKKVERKSSTLGAKPPAGAIVLFDGSSVDKFKDGRMTKDGLLMEGTTSKQKFKNFSIHLEFMVPFMPSARGQGRGNSGYYSQGRYETQILDSFGLAPKNNECGAIYGVSAPRINMSYPPLSWQTYDVDFTAAVTKDGKRVKGPRLTVRHNGVEVQKDVEVPGATTSAVVRDGAEDGPIHLQNHGNPVRFRNIWVIER